MKSLNRYINEEKKITGGGCVEMIKTIIDQLKNDHPDCSYDKENKKWTGKDADLWNGASQFLFDYVHELDQASLKKIVDAMDWKKWIPDVDDINPAEISMCMSMELMK